MATTTVERYPQYKDQSIRTQTFEQPGGRRKVGILSRVADALRRVTFGLSYSGLLLPVGPSFRDSKGFSLKEKAEIEGFRICC
jgi:hypothetical protein